MKRILALFMTAFMLVMMVPETVNAASENITVSVKADRSTAIAGDTVNFEVAVGKVDSLGGLEFKLSIPAGLTFVADSVALPEGIETLMDSDGAIVKPTVNNGYKWSYSAQNTGYTGTADLTILTFSCTVDADSALEDKVVSLNITTCFDNINLDDHVVTVAPATVTVKAAPIYVSGVTLDKTTLAMKDGETAALVATVAPENADNKNVTWTSSNTSVATVENGTVTAKAVGTATITVTTADGNKTATCEVTVTHAHNMQKTDANAATCVQEGNIEYYTCTKCNKMYADEAGTQELTDVTVPATGHTAATQWSSDDTNHWKECTECGEDLDKAAHAYEWVVDTEATTEAAGSRHQECECGHKTAENTEIPQLTHEHEIKAHAAEVPTCKTEGMKEHWTCSHADCAGKYFSDDKCQLEVAVEDLKIAVVADNHVFDNDADTECNECGYKKVTYQVVAGANGTFTKDSATGLTIRVDGDFSKFAGVWVNGKELVRNKDYTAVAGSTVITFTPEYLNSLGNATHDVVVTYNDGKVATTQFTIKAAAAKPAPAPAPDNSDDTANTTTTTTPAATSPKTGEPGTAWVAIAMLAFAGVVVVLVMKRKSAE